MICGKIKVGETATLIIPDITRTEPIIVFIIQCFEENNDENTEPCFNGCVPNAPAILDKIKWNSKPHPPPPPKARMKAREEQKRTIFPSVSGGGGLGFPLILSKIVALVILSLLLEIMLWASNLSYL